MDHLKKGSTQVKAFDEAASLLNRSSSACAFRWNGVVKKQYAIEVHKIKEEVSAGIDPAIEDKKYIQPLSITERSEFDHVQLSPKTQMRQEQLDALSLIVTSVDAVREIFEFMSNNIIELELKLEQREHEIAKLKKEANTKMNDAEDVAVLLDLLQKAKQLGIMERLG